MNLADIHNAAAMREALKTVKRYFDGYTVNVPEMRSQVDAALAAPPRNCDVGTAAEQEERLYKFCENQPCSTCRLKGATYRECALIWAQLPCGPEEGEVGK